MKAISGGSALTTGQRKIVKMVLAHIESELIATLPELNQGIQNSTSGGSFSVTLNIKPAKRGNFKATVAARIRSPREALELDMHLGKDDQLTLGLNEGWDEEEEEATG